MASSEIFKFSKDVFESSYTWCLENFKELIAEGLMYDEWKTKPISIEGLPFNW